MGCDECDLAQEQMDLVSYVRIGKANVMVVGCNEHLKEMFEQLRGK